MVRSCENIVEKWLVRWMATNIGLCEPLNTSRPNFYQSLIDWHQPGCDCGRASALWFGGPWFNSQGKVILKTLKMVLMAPFIGAQELKVSINYDWFVGVRVLEKSLSCIISHKEKKIQRCQAFTATFIPKIAVLVQGIGMQMVMTRNLSSDKHKSFCFIL